MSILIDLGFFNRTCLLSAQILSFAQVAVDVIHHPTSKTVAKSSFSSANISIDLSHDGRLCLLVAPPAKAVQRYPIHPPLSIAGASAEGTFSLVMPRTCTDLGVRDKRVTVMISKAPPQALVHLRRALVEAYSDPLQRPPPPATPAPPPQPPISSDGAFASDRSFRSLPSSAPTVTKRPLADTTNAPAPTSLLASLTQEDAALGLKPTIFRPPPPKKKKLEDDRPSAATTAPPSRAAPSGKTLGASTSGAARPAPSSALSGSVFGGSGGSFSGSMTPRPQADLASTLTVEQRQAIDYATSGRSFFLSGAAGCGKSHTLHYVTEALKRKHTGRNAVCVTASTGLAAVNMNGTTLHSFAGIGLGEAPVEELYRTALRNEETKARWLQCACLVVDEISMVQGSFLNRLSEVGKRLRRDPRPFGGIAVVFCGDFHQLPPVARGPDPHNARFAFQSAAWKESIGQSCVMLSQVFRQSDSDFIALLHRVRGGEATAADTDRLKRLCEDRRRQSSAVSSSQQAASALEATQLHTHRADTDRVNGERLRSLPGESRRFNALDEGATQGLSLLKSNCLAKDVVELREGAQVMLCKTIDAASGLVNGTRGAVTGFSASGMPVVEFAGGKRMTMQREEFVVKVGGAAAAKRRQLPLALAYALSVHKSQGMTLDLVTVDLANAFEPGMAYVALSRARAPEGLFLKGAIHPRALEADPAVVEFYKSLKK